MVPFRANAFFSLPRSGTRPWLKCRQGGNCEFISELVKEGTFFFWWERFATSFWGRSFYFDKIRYNKWKQNLYTPPPKKKCIYMLHHMLLHHWCQSMMGEFFYYPNPNLLPFESSKKLSVEPPRRVVPWVCGACRSAADEILAQRPRRFRDSLDGLGPWVGWSL